MPVGKPVSPKSLQPSRVQHPSMIPSLLPDRVFSDHEDAQFLQMADDADIEALVDFLFPDS